MHIMLVEPDYYTRYPPLGLLKLSAYHKMKGDTVELVRGKKYPTSRPDLIYVTSLFTWAWKPVWDAVQYYKLQFPDVELRLGGIYASLLPDHASLSGADYVHVGLRDELEDLMPDYGLIPEWNGSIIFASRGCVRKCGFCSVPKLEGKPSALKYGVKHLLYPKHTRIIFYDNNILGNPNWKDLFDEVIDLKLAADFNQGLDARLITDDAAERLSKMEIFPFIRLAYDYSGIKKYVEKAIQLLAAYGVRRRNIMVFVLFNYTDDPQDFFERIRDLLNWGVVAYPMRYEPLCALEKNKYIAPKWDLTRLRMVQRARRVIGYGGAFPPYKGLVDKLNDAKDFDEALSLRPEIKGASKVSVEALAEHAADMEHEPPKKFRKTYFASWRKERDWRKTLHGR